MNFETQVGIAMILVASKAPKGLRDATYKMGVDAIVRANRTQEVQLLRDGASLGLQAAAEVGEKYWDQVEASGEDHLTPMPAVGSRWLRSAATEIESGGSPFKSWGVTM